MFANVERYQRYPVIALPPLKGADQFRLRVVDAVEGIAERSVTGSGTVRGLFEAVNEYGPYPITFLAAIWK
jgi:hypothetical protein